MRRPWRVRRVASPIAAIWRVSMALSLLVAVDAGLLAGSDSDPGWPVVPDSRRNRGGSGGAGGQGGLHRGGCAEGTEHLHRGNRGQGQLGGDIGGGARCLPRTRRGE